jgi:hypothetical protein
MVWASLGSREDCLFSDFGVTPENCRPVIPILSPRMHESSSRGQLSATRVILCLPLASQIRWRKGYRHIAGIYWTRPALLRRLADAFG